MVHTFALIVLILLNVDPSVHNRGSNVPEEEHRNGREHESDPVLSDSNVEVSILLKSGKGVVPSVS